MAAAAPAAAAPSDLAVIVTNANYDDASIPAVKYAAKDGASMATAMMEVFGVARENVHSFKDLTKSGLERLFGPENRPDQGSLFKWVQSARKPDARIYVYFSGHGMPHLRDDGSATDAYLMTRDASFDDLAVTAYPLKTLRDNLVNLKQLVPNGQIILILESCFSGRAGNGEAVQQNSSQVGLDIDFGSPAAGILEIDAAKGNQAAFWDDKNQHGVFTDQFLWAVYGLADDPQLGGNGDGQVTVGEMMAFVNKRMPGRLKVNKRGGAQTAALFGAEETVLSSGGRRKRTDMAAIEREEEVNCGALEKAENRNYTRLNEDIARIRKFLDEDCRLCECSDKLENRQRQLEEKQQVCTAVAEQIRVQTDPVILRQYAETNQCSQLHDAIIQRAKDLEEARDKQVCQEEQGHWNDAKKRGDAIGDLELAAAQMSCDSMRNSAQAEIRQRRAAEGITARMKAQAIALGPWPPNGPFVKSSAVTGNDVFYKFDLAGNDRLGIQLEDQTGNLDIDVRNQSYDLVGKAGPESTPNVKQVVSTRRDLTVGTYYIRIAPAEGRGGGSYRYTLRVSKNGPVPPPRTEATPMPNNNNTPVNNNATANNTPTMPPAPSAATHFTRDTAGVIGMEPVVLPEGREYWAMLTVPGGSRMKPALSWKALSPDADIDLDFDVFKGQADRLPDARSRGTLPNRRDIDPLGPGTYMIHVYRSSGKGAVSFNFTMERTELARVPLPSRTAPPPRTTHSGR
jgi:hypothetical protein